MGKGDKKHKSNRQRGRQRKFKARKAVQDAAKRKQRKADGHVPAPAPEPKQYKKAVVGVDKVATPSFGHAANIPSPPATEDLLATTILPDSWAICPYGCGRTNDVLNKRPGDVVICHKCDKKFKLVADKLKPQPAVPAPLPPPPPPPAKPQVKRKGNSPWCTCPDCLRGVRIKGSYTAVVDEECPYCGAKFTVLPA